MPQQLPAPERLRHFIDGGWVDATATTWREVRNPATGALLAQVPMAGAADVHRAVDAAQAAGADWRATPAATRARCLFALKELMERDFDGLSATVVREHGKTLDEARGEVRRGIENVELACGMPSLLTGYHLPDVASGIDEWTQREPLGVCAVVPPYNFPLMVPLWFLPVATACGNPVIIKPSEQVPLSASRLVGLCDQAGFPPGVVSLVHGGREAVEALVDAPEVRALSFVGSSPVAKALYARATAAGKRAQCQGGAKNAIVVMPDADPLRTVPALITSFYGCAGQRCLAGSVLVAVGDCDALVARFVAAAAALTVGDGMDEGIQMGPLVSTTQRDKVAGWIDRGVAEGARLALDGRGVRPAGCDPAAFIGPTVFDAVTPAMAIAREEIFGPVACIVRVRDLDAALDFMAQSPFGNAAAIFTNSGKAAREFRRRAGCGNIGINIGVPAPVACFPFGGMRGSFYGDLHGQGRDGVEFFTDRQVVIERWP